MSRAPWNVTTINALPADQTLTSTVIYTALASEFGISGTIANGTNIAGTLQINFSNDQQPSGLAPGLFQPTNFFPGPAIPINGNGTLGNVQAPICAKWMQMTWTPSAGTGGTFTVHVNLRDGS